MRVLNSSMVAMITSVRSRVRPPVCSCVRTVSSAVSMSGADQCPPQCRRRHRRSVGLPCPAACRRRRHRSDPVGAHWYRARTGLRGGCCSAPTPPAPTGYRTGLLTGLAAETAFEVVCHLPPRHTSNGTGSNTGCFPIELGTFATVERRAARCPVAGFRPGHGAARPRAAARRLTARSRVVDYPHVHPVVGEDWAVSAPRGARAT